ncbi:MAG: hypothetical protein PHI97_09250 [Desulfobulbus sp.]|nr:hypothetical protein [Desulfobulbus sp.]
MTTAESQVMNDVFYRLIPLIGGDKFLFYVDYPSQASLAICRFSSLTTCK